MAAALVGRAEEISPKQECFFGLTDRRGCCKHTLPIHLFLCFIILSYFSLFYRYSHIFVISVYKQNSIADY